MVPSDDDDDDGHDFDLEEGTNLQSSENAGGQQRKDAKSTGGTKAGGT